MYNATFTVTHDKYITSRKQLIYIQSIFRSYGLEIQHIDADIGMHLWNELSKKHVVNTHMHNLSLAVKQYKKAALM